MCMTYKLIKEYPGSPELGTVVELDNNTVTMDNSHYSTNSFKYRGLDGRRCFIPNKHVRDYPEYWQKES